MRAYFIRFFLLLKRQLNYRLMTIFLIAMPVCVYIISSVPQLNESEPVRIGMLAAGNDILARQTMQHLIESSDSTTMEYYEASSADELNNDIISGRTDCGYIFPDNLSACISGGKYSGCIKLVSSPSSMMASLSSEMVFHSMFGIFGQSIAADYASSLAGTDSTASHIAKDYVNERFDYYLNGPATFHVEFRLLDVSGKTRSGTYGTSVPHSAEYQADTQLFPLRGILAILITIAAMFGCSQYITDKESGVFLAMQGRMTILGRLVYTAIPTILFALSSLLSLMLSGSHSGLSEELSSITVFAAICILFAFALSLCIRKSRIMMSIIPLYAILCLVCCPVFIDLGSYLPPVSVLQKLLIPYYYISVL